MSLRAALPLLLQRLPRRPVQLRPISSHIDDRLPKSDEFVYNVMRSAPLEEINRAMHSLLPNPKDVEKKRQKVRQVHSLLSRLLHGFRQHPHAQLVTIGSVCSGLLSPSSDVDMIYVADGRDEAGRKRAETDWTRQQAQRDHLMYGVAARFKSHTAVTYADVLRHARKPIIQMTVDGLKVDVQFHDLAPLYSTNYVRICVASDPRVPLLIHWLKRVLESGRLLASNKGLFSTFHATSIALHFLQLPLCGGEMDALPVLPPMHSTLPHLLSPDRNWKHVVDGMEEKQGIPSHILEEMELDGISTPLELSLRAIHWLAETDMQEWAMDTAKAAMVKRDDTEDTSVIIRDPYFPSQPSVCMVQNGAHILQSFFQQTAADLLNGDYSVLLVRGRGGAMSGGGGGGRSKAAGRRR